MQFGIIYSILLHLVFLLLVLFGIPNIRPLPEHSNTMVVEMIEIAPITNIKTMQDEPKEDTKTLEEDSPKTVLKDNEFDNPNISKSPKAAEPEPKKVEPIKEEKKPEPVKEEIKKVEEKPIEKKVEEKKLIEEEKEKVPTKKAKEEKKNPEEKKPEKPKKEKKPEPVKKVEEKKPPEKEKKKPSKNKPQPTKDADDELANAILKSLHEGSKKSSKKSKKTSLNDIMENAIKGETTTDYDDQKAMSMSEIDAIRAQISKAWRVTSFSGGGERMTVTAIIIVDKNGEVQDIKIKDSGDGSNFYKIFVDSVIRAIKTASPLQNLPQEKHDTWGEMELVFDSSGMIY